MVDRRKGRRGEDGIHSPGYWGGSSSDAANRGEGSEQGDERLLKHHCREEMEAVAILKLRSGLGEQQTNGLLFYMFPCKPGRPITQGCHRSSRGGIAFWCRSPDSQSSRVPLSPIQFSLKSYLTTTKQTSLRWRRNAIPVSRECGLQAFQVLRGKQKAAGVRNEWCSCNTELMDCKQLTRICVSPRVIAVPVLFSCSSCGNW